MPRKQVVESWGRSTVHTACPLDCPDSCSLDVTVERGRIVKMDGGHDNPVTKGYICAKVRRFPERVYGEDRLLYPAIRQGAKGQGTFTRVSWGEALDHTAAKMKAIRDSDSAEAILPFCYGGSNGLLTQDTNDAVLFRGFATSRLARTVCAAPTGAANQMLYGKMPGVTYVDYVHARLIVLWGVNPSASGIHLMPYLTQARSWWSWIRARRCSPARRICISRPGREPIFRSRWQFTATSSSQAVRTSDSWPSTHAAPTSCAAAQRTGHSSEPRRFAAYRQQRSSNSRKCTRRPRRRWCVADGASSETAMAAVPRPLSWRSPQWPASSACAAADSR